MSTVLTLEPQEWERFSVPHALRLVGEEQHLIGAGSISVATNLRLQATVEEIPGEFSLRLGGGERDPDGRWQDAEAPLSDLAARSRQALEEVVAPDPSALEGLDVEVDFGRLWEVCPPQALGSSPALAVALAVAILAHRGQASEVGELQLAETACRLCDRLAGEANGSAGRFYGDALLSVIGGAGYVEPGRERLNVQQLLPPESLLLVMAPGLEGAGRPHSFDAVVRGAAEKARSSGGLGQPGDAAFGALFELAGSVLNDEEVTKLYGLMRVRQMTEAFLEYLTEPLVDNDRLAEICDEESAILVDYFGFPAARYERIRAAASTRGALGSKLTWAFGGYPAAIVLAPGRRQEVGEALVKEFPGLYCILTDMDLDGLVAGEHPAFESAP